jgi:hypothetical protein
MAFAIVRNCGGVPGLHLALNVFSEAAERRLFELTGPPAPRSVENGRVSRVGDAIFGPHDFPAEIFQALNAVRDCGLAPDLVCPDYCLCLTYAHGATFPQHFDSRYRWGEARCYLALLRALCLRCVRCAFAACAAPSLHALCAAPLAACAAMRCHAKRGACG